MIITSWRRAAVVFAVALLALTGASRLVTGGSWATWSICAVLTITFCVLAWRRG